MAEENGKNGSSIAPGTMLEKFTFVRRIALGGMAEIWLAHEKKGDGRLEPVALKVLLAPYAKDPTFRSMFTDEVRIAARLTHENVVQVFGAFELDGHLVQAMELVDGKDLRRVLSTLAREGVRFPIPLALVIAREVSRALAYAHTRRGDDGKPLEIVHRDISPHNVMITYDGGVKLLDFGIAKAAERLTRTRTGVIKGKIAYMAPEQALAVGVTPKTDIFSTGIVLWEMLAMQRLFKADTDALVLERVIRADVPPIKDYNPEVPEEVAALLHQMLAQRAQMRPDSARTVENALTRIILRHYGEKESSREALATWAVQFLEQEKRTGRISASDLGDLAGAASAFAATAVRGDGGAASGDVDSTLPDSPIPQALKDSLDKSDKTVATDIREEAQTIALALAIDGAANTPATPAAVSPSPLPKGEDKTTDPVRLPTRSEIQRAVDAQNTMPVSIDQQRASAEQRAVVVRHEVAKTEAVEIVSRAPVATVEVVSGSQDATKLGDLAPVAVPEPKDDDFKPMKIPIAQTIPIPDTDKDKDSLEPTTLPPATRSSSMPVPASSISVPPEEQAVSSLRGVILVIGVLAAAALGLVIAVVLRSCR